MAPYKYQTVATPYSDDTYVTLALENLSKLKSFLNFDKPGQIFTEVHVKVIQMQLMLCCTISGKVIKH